MKKKQALFLYYELAGYFVASLRELVRLYNVDVHVVRYPVNNVAPFTFENINGITWYERPTHNAASLIHLANTIEPDFIFCCGWADKDYIAVCRHFASSTTTILSLDNPWQGKLKQHIGAMIGKLYLKKIFQYIWVPGTPQVEYSKQLGFKKNEIFTGLYAADLQHFNVLYEKYKHAKEKQFPKRILYVGRYTAHKGVQEMWKAFVKFHKHTPNDWELWCLGKGELEHMMPAHEKIKNFGFVQPEQLGDYIAQCGVFILASRLEHWGVVIQEFAAAGMPIISSNKTSAAHDFVIHNKSGWIVNAADEQSMYHCFQQVNDTSASNLNAMAQESHRLAQQLTPAKWAATAWMMLNKHTL